MVVSRQEPKLRKYDEAEAQKKQSPHYTLTATSTSAPTTRMLVWFYVSVGPLHTEQRQLHTPCFKPKPYPSTTLGFSPESGQHMNLSTFNAYAQSFSGDEWLASGKEEALPWNQLPFSSPLAPILGTVFYVSLHVVLGGLITEKNKVSLTPLMAVYNFALAASSAVLFGVLTWTVWGVYSEYGFEGVWNDPNVRRRMTPPGTHTLRGGARRT